MQITISPGTVTVTREPGDPTFGRNESAFWYALKKKLIGMGYPCIKKRMWKDGHLVDDEQMYVRSPTFYRRGSAGQRVSDYKWSVYYNHHALRFVSEDFDKGGTILCIQGELS